MYNTHFFQFLDPFWGFRLGWYLKHPLYESWVVNTVVYSVLIHVPQFQCFLTDSFKIEMVKMIIESIKLSKTRISKSKLHFR